MSPGNRSALSAKASQLQAAKTLTQDLPRGASPSPTLPKDFDSSKHISCEIPTIFPETPLDHGHAKFLDGMKEDTPLEIVNNPDDNSSTVSVLMIWSCHSELHTPGGAKGGSSTPSRQV
ncbi:hypothetical protein BU17DRAFT_70492 [Hysterangium stoloniferum]|nr:hypothetical protein BU17DRAFT_70492 [Hysterangium stoloniferum]